MPIRLTDFSRERRDLVIPTPSGDINVTYSPNVLTPSDEAKILAARANSPVDSYRELLTQFCRILIAWDLVGPVLNSDSGEEIVAEDAPIPVKPEILQHVPSPVITLIFRAISEDNVPKSSKAAKTGTASSKNSGSIYSGSFD